MHITAEDTLVDALDALRAIERICQKHTQKRQPQEVFSRDMRRFGELMKMVNRARGLDNRQVVGVRLREIVSQTTDRTLKDILDRTISTSFR